MKISVQEKNTIKQLLTRLLDIRHNVEYSLDTFPKQIHAIHQTILDINAVLFPSECIEMVYQPDFSDENKIAYIKEFDKWYDFVEKIIFQLENTGNTLDGEFYLLMSYLEAVNVEELQNVMKQNLQSLKDSDIKLYEKLICVYEVYKDFWGKLNPEDGVYDCIILRAQALKEHVEEWIWLYKSLCDNRSRKILYNILMNWITFDIAWLRKSSETVFEDYFDLDLIPETTEEEVFVDLGGYIGDTVESFVSCYSEKYKRIYTYEINDYNYQELLDNVETYHDVIPRKVAVGENAGKMFLNMEIGGSSTTLAKTGDQAIEVVSIDDDIQEKITWIKMDIEGAEQAALRGCRRHIEEEQPKLTICTYHNNEDIWKIPQMIKSYNKEYKLYLRYNGNKDWPSEYVLFAL